jgi:uncharacterized membrane protein YebE (DUF533 family)
MDYFLQTIAGPTAALILVAGKIWWDWWANCRMQKSLAANTALTQAARDEAAKGRAAAQQAVTVAQNSAQDTKEALNGRLDQLIQAAVAAALANAALKKESP